MFLMSSEPSTESHKILWRDGGESPESRMPIVSLNEGTHAHIFHECNCYSNFPWLITPNSESFCLLEVSARIWSQAPTLALGRPPPQLLPSHLPETFIRVCSPGSSDHLFIWAFVERAAREFHSFLFQEGEAPTVLAEPAVRVWMALDGGGWLWDLLRGLGWEGGEPSPDTPWIRRRQIWEFMAEV